MMTTPDYEQILQSSNHGVIATDEKGKIVFINIRARAILQFGKRKIVGRNISTLLPLTGELVIDCLNSGNSQLGSQIVGKRLSLVVNINAMRSRQKIVGAVCNFLTMEEFEASARNLESFDFLDKQFKSVFESSSDGLWICDREGKVVNINRASEKLGGIKRQEIIGRKVSDIIKKGMYSNYVTDEVIQTKRPVSQLQHIRNTNKTVLCTGIPVLDRHGDISLVVINERDITQLEVIKKQLEKTRKEREKYRDELAELSMLELKNQKIVAESDQMLQIMRTALKLAHMEVTDILLLGESGTGKGLLRSSSIKAASAKRNRLYRSIVRHCLKRFSRPSCLVMKKALFPVPVSTASPAFLNWPIKARFF